MLTLDGTATSASTAGVRGIALLVDLAFSGGTQYFTTWGVNIVSGGNTYQAFGSMVDVQGLGESEDSGAERITMEFTIVNTAVLAQAIGDATVYRGRDVTIRGQFMNDTYQPAGAAVVRWKGKMSKHSIQRRPSKSGPGTGRIKLECVRAGARFRNAEGLRLTHAQQQKRFAGDVGLEYVAELVEKPTLWLSKRFQEV